MVGSSPALTNAAEPAQHSARDFIEHPTELRPLRWICRSVLAAIAQGLAVASATLRVAAMFDPHHAALKPLGETLGAQSARSISLRAR